MKFNKYYLTAIIAITLVTGFVTSCDKSIEDSEQLNAFVPGDIDVNAGTWDMIVLTAPDQIAVPAPDAVGSDAYKAELTTIKNAQNQLTEKQKGIIEYWSGGGILRWNQK